jgi:hypothetical protein
MTSPTIGSTTSANRGTVTAPRPEEGRTPLSGALRWPGATRSLDDAFESFQP